MTRRWMIAGTVLSGAVAVALLVRAEGTAAPSAVATTSSTAPASTQPLPTAQEVIDRYIEATGGKEAYASLTSRRLEARYEMADLGVHGTLTVDLRADGHARQVTTVPGLDTFLEGVNREIAWRTDQMTGPRLLNGVEAQSLRLSLSFAPDISLEPYRDATVTAIEEIGGVPCHKMELRLKAVDATEIRYYDTRTGYLIRKQGFLLSDDGLIEVLTRYGDYEDAPPIRMPMKIRQSISGLSPEQVTTKVQHNVNIPDEVFAIPDEIRQLLDRATTRPAE